MTADAIALARVPPYSTEAEQAVLGALLLDNGVLPGVQAVLAREAFYSPGHRAVYGAVLDLVGAGQVADPMTVAQHHAVRGVLTAPLQYVNALASSVPSARGVGSYAEIVRRRAVRRRLLAVADELVHRALSEPDDDARATEAMVGDAVEQLLAAQSAAERWEPTRLAELLSPWFDRLQDKADGRIKPVSTGLRDLDRALGGGLEPGQLIVLGARPSMGKSATALALADAAQSPEAAVLYCSQEDSHDMLTSRVVARTVGVDLARLRQPQYATGDDWERLSGAMESLYGHNVWYDEQPGVTVSAVLHKAQHVLARAGRLNLVVVDYLQLMEGEQAESRHRELGAMVIGLKALAKRLHVPVLLLSQLSRKADEVKGPPRLDHLRESGSIEEAADVVMLLWRGHRVLPDKYPADEMQIEVPKNKNGPTSTVKLTWDGARQRIMDRDGGDDS